MNICQPLAKLLLKAHNSTVELVVFQLLIDVGNSADIDIDFCVEELKDEDTLLICTDGLTNYVDIDEIREITAENSFYGYAESLVRRANENGGGDNITVVALAY